MNNTLANGLTLLELLSSTAESFSVTELARRLEAPKSHAHRLLQTLVERGYAVQDEDRRYRIGFQPLAVSSALLANHPLRGAARPWLHQVAAELGLDAILTIPDHGSGLVLASAYPEGRQVDPATAIGNRMQPRSTATAALYEALIEGFVTPATLSAHRRREIRREDLALKGPLGGNEVNGMAVPIRDAEDHVVAALGCSGPGQRFTRQFDQASALLRAAATTIAGALPAPVVT